jgi:hypothetical protein
MGAVRHPNVLPLSSVAFGSSIILNFEEVNSEGSPPQRQMFFTQSSGTHFPIPENYWVSPSFNGSPVCSFQNTHK